MVTLKELARLDAERAPPAWLRPLLETKFFEACPEHPGATRSVRSVGCNFFCTHCVSQALCLADHADRRHQVIQSSCHGMLKVADLEHLLSVSLVQTYLINGEAAVFLDKRPISGKEKPGATRCEECDRGLQDAGCRFCSLRCKAEGIEDRLDFSMSFAVDARRDSEGDESETESESESESDEDDDDSFRPNKVQKLGTLSGSRRVAARRH